jgi:hypothetical protein
MRLEEASFGVDVEFLSPGFDKNLLVGVQLLDLG